MEDLVVFRSSSEFPPSDAAYVPLALRRGFPDGIGPSEKHRRASLGLSTYASLDYARTQGRRNALRIGPFLVRYVIPAAEPFRLEHLIGDPEHLTLFGPFERLHGFLDWTWLEDVTEPPY